MLQELCLVLIKKKKKVPPLQMSHLVTSERMGSGHRRSLATLLFLSYNLR